MTSFASFCHTRLGFPATATPTHSPVVASTQRAANSPPWMCFSFRCHWLTSLRAAFTVQGAMRGLDVFTDRPLGLGPGARGSCLPRLFCVTVSLAALPLVRHCRR